MPQKYVLRKVENKNKVKKLNTNSTTDQYVDFSVFENINISELTYYNNINILQKNLDNIIFHKIDMCNLPPMQSTPHIHYNSIKLFQISQEGLKECLRQQETYLDILDKHMSVYESKKK